MLTRGLSLVGCLLLTGCLFGGSKPGAVHLAEEYETFQGFRVADAQLRDGEERLDIFIGIPEEPKEGEPQNPAGEEMRFKEVIYCVAENREEEPLPEVHGLINGTPADKRIYLYGKRVKEKYKIWWDGLDCKAYAAAIWHVKARKYLYYDLKYGTPLREWLSIRRILKKAVEKGTDAAAGAASGAVIP